MAYESGYVCDGCGIRVDSRDAHGWLGIATMNHPQRTEPTPDVSATVCSMDCLFAWADEQPDPDDTQPETRVEVTPYGLVEVSGSAGAIAERVGQYL